MNTRIRRTAVAVAAAAMLPFSLTACSSDDNGSDASETGGQNDTDRDEAQETDEGEDGEDGRDDASGPFGPACAGVPEDGAGSFDGMAQDPVATAASNNPALTTLVAAVGEAGLVDTLNSADALTVFAPTDDAFAKLPEEDLDAVLADQELLTSILTYHVVSERLTPEQLAGGAFETLQGGTVDVAGSGESFTVDGNEAVVCGDVQTANATVYLIDTVLMP